MLFSALLASLFFFSGIAVAGHAWGEIWAPACTDYKWKWTYNSLGQSPCEVAAYVLSVCNGGSYKLPALPKGYSYFGPSGPDDCNLCECNIFTYSLLSACDACQGEKWIPWEEYSYNCTKFLPPKEICEYIPPKTRLPYWTAIDVTIEGTWDPAAAKEVGDQPEILSGKK